MPAAGKALQLIACGLGTFGIDTARRVSGDDLSARPRRHCRPGPMPVTEPPPSSPASSEAPADEDLLWQRPSPKLLRCRRIQVSVVTIPVAVIAGVACASISDTAGAGIAAGVAILGLLAERFLARRVASWGFAERNEDLMIRRGVLIRRQSVIPYGRMQYIDITAGPLERSLGLATLRMHTAAAASDARIPGLDQAVAAKLRDQLASLGEAQAAGL
jgi:membrane protein YdbS with pleckstrin-like domain